MSFNASTVVITGGSRGIGREIALVFARETDHALFLIARDQESLDTVRDECLDAGATLVQTAVCNLVSSDSVDALDIPTSLPAPSILINNAGTFLLKKLQDTTLSEFEGQWAINVKAPFLLTNKLLPMIHKQDRGLIVNISSIGGLSGQARSGAYSSSKHGMLGFSRSLRRELEGSRIAVTTINLGQTMSTSWEGVDVDPNELNDPEDVGKLIVSLTRLSYRSVAEEIILRPIGGDRSPD